METAGYSEPKPTQQSPWLIGIVVLALLALAAFWYFSSRSNAQDLKHAFTLNHRFENPIVFYGGNDLRYDIAQFDRRLIKVYVNPQELGSPKFLLVEDGELDHLGYVKKDQSFVPLQLYQIHNARPGRPTAPVTDCKTFIEVAAPSDSILVMIDGKYLLPGKKVGPNLFVINFCETTREHQFQVLGLPNARLGIKGGITALGVGGEPAQSYWYRVGASGDTIRYGLNPALYAMTTPGGPQAIAQIPGQGGSRSPQSGGNGIRPAEYSTGQSAKSPAVTKVIFSMPRSMRSPWVYLNDKRITNFTQNATGTQVIFWVKQEGQSVNVRVGDTNCECSANGRAYNPTLELNGYCQCRDVHVYVQLDPGLDRYRNKLRIYIDGQEAGIALPPAGQPLMFPVRKLNRDQYVELKLLLPDDTGNTGLFDVCNFTVPAEATTVNISPSCHCAECPPNVKVSG